MGWLHSCLSRKRTKNQAHSPWRDIFEASTHRAHTKNFSTTSKWLCETQSTRLSSSREHMPPISYDINIDEEDKWWLEKIDNLVAKSGKEFRRLRKALEYFYLGWFLEPNERVAFNFMALDAVFGHGSETLTTNFKARIPSTLEKNIDDVRLAKIVLFRNQFLHGRIPDIYDSTLYECYLRTYKCDPIIDIEYLTASCLRRLVFGVDFQMQPNPYQAEIQKFKDRGLIPTQPSQQTIIQEK